MNPWFQTIIAIGTSVLASSGLWTFVEKRSDKHSTTNRMLIGLAHDRIISLGMSYLERGDWITYDEYENLNDYLYTPYHDMGGNGSAERIMKDINNKLRLVKLPPIKEN